MRTRRQTRKKWMLLVPAAAMALALGYARPASAATYSACGVDAIVGGGTPIGCLSLPEAIAAATANPGADTIMLEGGDYCPIVLTGDNGELSFVGRGFSAVTGTVPGAVTGPEAEASIFTSHANLCTDTGVLVQINDDPYTISFEDVSFEGERASNQGKGIVMGDNHTTLGPPKGSLVLRDVIVKDNDTGVWFQGFTPARFEMSGSTITGNSTGVELSNLSSATVTNSTFEGNTTYGLHAGSNYAVNLNNDTFVRNGYGVSGLGSGNRINLSNSIIAGNLFRDCDGVEIASLGNNLSTGYCGVSPILPSDQFAIPLTIAPLDLNGGRTWTILPPGEAVGHANQSTCPVTDQRGFLRNDGACDVGAVELFAQPPPPPPPVYDTPPSTTPQTKPFFGGAVTVTFSSVAAGGNTTVTKSAAGPAIPAGFTLNGSYYDVSTTATFSTAVLCITDPSLTTASRLLHYAGPVDVTQLPVAPPTICSTALTSFSPFAIVQPAADTTPPSLSLSHTTNGSNGWNVSGPVPVTINANDAGSGLAGSPSCTDTYNGSTSSLSVTGSSLVSVAGDGTHVVTCTVSDVAGNAATPATETVKLDTQAPAVTYTGGAASYVVGQVVDITCSSSDAASGSGVASSTCANIVGPASTFPVGPNTFSATATDVAGNVGHGSTTFTITATPPATIGSLCLKTREFIESSARYNALSPYWKAVIDPFATAACALLPAKFAQLTAAQKTLFLNAYKADLRALVQGGWLTQSQATILVALANQI